jgi:hypothetical protein
MIRDFMEIRVDLRMLSEDSAPEGFEDGFGFGVDVEFLVDVADVEANRVLANGQNMRRGFIRVAVGQQL